MFDSSDTIDIAFSCELCEGELDLERYVEVVHDTAFTFCSVSCALGARRARRALRWAARRRSLRRLVVGTVLVAGWLTPHEGPASHAPRPVSRAPAPRLEPPGPEVLPPGWFGPQWPPTESSLLEALGRDAWVHPLSGPLRRMPRSDSRVFGADRPGNRAIECRNGHCGVDLGGEIWGEHVRAVHDGVVDYVQRGPNPDHGGRFVRIAHHGGTVFTQYFHLAAIARGIERGVPVKSGQVIGLLGDSGVKESQPHLHFAVSVRPSPEGHERYIDPEPLIALWPLRVPVDGSEVGLVTITAAPGVPLGSALRHSHRAKPGKGGAPAAASPAGESPDDAPAQTPPSDDGAPAAPGESSAAGE